MSRIRTTGAIIQSLPDVKSLLDVGCRDGILREAIPAEVDYFGCDLFAVGDHVRYVGDFAIMEFSRKFDVVTANDVLEHLDQPHAAFDKLASLADRCVIVSLPNCYDLKSRYKFAVKGRLGGKYDFGHENTLDRHRWVMGTDEICDFYGFKAKQHGLSLRVHHVRYGSDAARTLSGVMGRVAAAALPSQLATHTIVGEFTKA